MKISGNKRNGRYVQSSNSRYQAEQQPRRRYESTEDQRPAQTSGRAPERYQRTNSQGRIAGINHAGMDSRVGMTSRDGTDPRARTDPRDGMDTRAARAAAKKKRQKRVRRILLLLLFIMVALFVVLYSVWKLGVKPPPMKPRPVSPAPSSEAAGSSPSAVSSDRIGTQYTFAIIGFDDGNGNTDTIMVANFDADNHKLSVVNIPRDTLVNVSWNTKKANTLYSSGGGIDGVTKGLSDILGFQVDFYIQVNLKAFKELVDAVGGVEFDVPMKMYYHDPAQNLLIDLQKGPQTLNGDNALGLVRFRKGYADADIGRIRTQQAFLSSAAEQILAKQDKLNLDELVGIFLKYVETDLSAGNLVWLGKEFYKMDSGNITFVTLPANYGDSVNGSSYVTIHVGEWLQILNEKINPFKDDIAAKDLSILTRDENGKLYVTNGVWAGKKSWGGGSSSGASGSASPSPKPLSSPKPETSPSDDASLSPSEGASESPTISPTQPSPSPTDTSPTDTSPTDASPEVSPSDAGGETPSASTPAGETSPSPSVP